MNHSTTSDLAAALVGMQDTCEDKHPSAFRAAYTAAHSMAPLHPLGKGPHGITSSFPSTELFSITGFLIVAVPPIPQKSR